MHRDLKPGNVMVGPDGTVKVLDFGLAKLVMPEEQGPEMDTLTHDQTPLTRPGQIAGTPGYLAPEQAAGGKTDARSDVFSLGALLYEMSTGRRAFAGRSAIFYWQGDRMMAVPITGDGDFAAGKPELQFEGHFERPSARPNYDVTPDGRRFVMVKGREREAPATQLNFVLGWLEAPPRPEGRQ